MLSSLNTRFGSLNLLNAKAQPGRPGKICRQFNFRPSKPDSIEPLYLPYLQGNQLSVTTIFEPKHSELKIGPIAGGRRPESLDDFKMLYNLSSKLPSDGHGLRTQKIKNEWMHCLVHEFSGFLKTHPEALQRVFKQLFEPPQS